MDNNNNELEIGENVQRDIPEKVIFQDFEPFDIAHKGDPKSGLYAREENVSKASNTYAMYGLIIAIIVLSATIGFLYSEIKDLRFIISKSNETNNNNQYLQQIEATNNELKTINQHIENVSHDINNKLSNEFSDGIIELDKKSYSIGEMMNIIVKDADMNANPGLKDEISVVIKNINEEQKMVLKLVEVTDNSGVFTRKVLLMKKTNEFVSGLGMMGVNINDSIVAVYYDEKTLDGKARDLVASANIIVW